MIGRRSFIKATFAAAAYSRFPYSGRQQVEAAVLSDKYRSPDVVDLRHFLDGSGKPGSEDFNNRAIERVLSSVRSNPNPILIKAHRGDVYRLSGEATFDFGELGRLEMGGGVFQWSGNLKNRKSPAFRFGKGWRIEGLELVALEGAAFRRLVDFDGGEQRISDVRISSESQVENSGTLLDYGVRILGDSNRVERLNVANIDKAILAYQGDGNRFVAIEVENFVTGFELRDQIRCLNIGYRCRGRSRNAKPDPGHNGILHAGVAEYTMKDFDINDAGEHGCRFGGTRKGEQVSRDIVLRSGRIAKSGQSGLKFFTGIAGQRFKNIDGENIDVFDCKHVRGSNRLPGFNDEGFLLQQISNGRFAGISVNDRTNTSGFSCDCAVFITGGDDLTIEGLAASRPRRNLIRISQWDDGVGLHPVEPLPNRDIRIEGAVGAEIGEDGVYIEHPTEPISNLTLDVDVAGINSPGCYAIKVETNSDLIAGRWVMSCRSSEFSAGDVYGPVALGSHVYDRS